MLRIVHGGEATEHTAGGAKRQAGRKGRAGAKRVITAAAEVESE
jgi:hypothetical protein